MDDIIENELTKAKVEAATWRAKTEELKERVTRQDALINVLLNSVIRKSGKNEVA